jgi:TIR domain-containing protein/helix-turn-helix protein
VSVDPDAPQQTPSGRGLGPSRVETPSELAQALRDLRVFAGSPTLREIADRARDQGLHAAYTTIGNAESGKHFPRLEVLEAFVRGCGVAPEEVEQWRDAWRRASANRLVSVRESSRSRLDFFVSYSAPDREWAEWIAYQLTEAGYSVELDAWDWMPGDNYIVKMQQAIARADRIIAVLSSSYFEPSPVIAEEQELILQATHGESGSKVIPVRVDSSELTGNFAEILAIDLRVDSEVEARKRLMNGLKPAAKPREAPRYPGAR